MSERKKINERKIIKTVLRERVYGREDFFKLASQDVIEHYVKNIIDKGGDPPIDEAILKRVSEEAVNHYIKDAIEANKIDSLSYDELKYVTSQELIDKIITEVTKQNMPIASKILLLGSKELVDKYVRELSKNENADETWLGLAIGESVMKKASQDTVNFFVKKMGERGIKLASNMVKLADQKIVDGYVKDLIESGDAKKVDPSLLNIVSDEAKGNLPLHKLS